MAEVAFRSPRSRLVAPQAIDHHVSDLTVTADASLMLAALQNRLSEHGQWLPIDGDPSLPLNKLIESNSSGPMRLGFGAWRDVLLGMQFTTKSGQLITAGGRTMKNVAGYDLTKLMIGQFGLFGTIETITTRTYRRPEAALLVKVNPSDKLMGQLIPQPIRPHWAMVAEGAMWLGYVGDERAMAFYESNLTALNPLEIRRQTLEQDIDFRARRWLPAERPPLRYRASVPPSRVLEFVSRAQFENFAADPAFGIAVGSCVVHRKDELREIAKSFGGGIIFEDQDDLRSYFGASGRELLLLRAIQSALDS